MDNGLYMRFTIFSLVRLGQLLLTADSVTITREFCCIGSDACLIAAYWGSIGGPCYLHFALTSEHHPKRGLVFPQEML
jgi:hypothetical protein